MTLVSSPPSPPVFLHLWVVLGEVSQSLKDFCEI